MIYGCYYKDISACVIPLILRMKAHMSLATVCFVKHVFGVQPSLDQYKKMQFIIDCCPVCSNSNISVIPLTNDDTYELYVRPNGGQEMK